MAAQPAIDVNTTGGIGTVSLSASGLPDNLTLTDNGDGTAQITGTVADGESAGSPYTVTITATDSSGQSDTETFDVTVAVPSSGPPEPTQGWAAYYLADDIAATDGDEIGTWPEGSGSPTNGLTNMSRTTGDGNVVWDEARINSQPSVRHSPVYDPFETSMSSSITNPTVIMVFQEHTSLSNVSARFDIAPSTSAYRSVITVNLSTLRVFYGPGAFDRNDLTIPSRTLNTPKISIISFGGTSYLDGASIGATTGTTMSEGLSLAFFSDGTPATTQIDVAFIGVVEGSLSTSDREAIESWAADKYGITI